MMITIKLAIVDVESGTVNIVRVNDADQHSCDNDETLILPFGKVVCRVCANDDTIVVLDYDHRYYYQAQNSSGPSPAPAPEVHVAKFVSYGLHVYGKRRDVDDHHHHDLLFSTHASRLFQSPRHGHLCFTFKSVLSFPLITCFYDDDNDQDQDLDGIILDMHGMTMIDRTHDQHAHRHRHRHLHIKLHTPKKVAALKMTLSAPVSNVRTTAMVISSRIGDEKQRMVGIGVFDGSCILATTAEKVCVLPITDHELWMYRTQISTHVLPASALLKDVDIAPLNSKLCKAASNMHFVPGFGILVQTRHCVRALAYPMQFTWMQAVVRAGTRRAHMPTAPSLELTYSSCFVAMSAVSAGQCY